MPHLSAVCRGAFASESGWQNFMMPPFYHVPEKGGNAGGLACLRLLKIFRSPLKKSSLAQPSFCLHSMEGFAGLKDFTARASTAKASATPATAKSSPCSSIRSANG